MTSYSSGPRAAVVSPRVAIISIVGFWLVYFLVATIRSLILGYGHQVEMLAARTMVTVGSMIATYIIYLAMRPLASRSLAFNVTAIALLGIPAAIAYSSLNITAFNRIDKKIIAEKMAMKPKQQTAQMTPEVAQVIAEAAREHAERAREAAQEIREAAKEQAQAAREAAEEARQAAREAVEEARNSGVNINVTLPPIPPLPPEARTPPTMMIQVGQAPADEKEHDMSMAAQIADNAMNGYFFFIAWGALYLALSYAAAVRAAEREAASYRAAARDAELRALRYQVNPHFLFNTLNSLSTLILKDHRDEAEKMVLNLATFFRTSLTADPTEDIQLDEEIRLQRLYLDIEAVRFPERLIIDIVIPPSLRNALVPCLILQPLIENAIKYGVSRSKRPVTIYIGAREDSQGLVLTVEDDGEPSDEAPAKGTGVGLKNVTDRLKARFGDEAGCRYGPLANGGFGVTLFMPLVRDGC